MNYLIITELQKNFDTILDRVESGETFYVKNNNKDFIMMPNNLYQELDELVRIHKDHEEGC